MIVSGGYATLKDANGKALGKVACNLAPSPGDTLSISGKEVEIDSVLSKGEVQATTPELAPDVPKVVFKPPRQSQTPASSSTVSFKKLPASVAEVANIHGRVSEFPRRTNLAFKNPMKQDSMVRVKSDGAVPTARHDPNAESALVMKRPHSVPAGKHVVDVVVDPILSKHLREHQRAGVAFMYECVMGMRPFDGEGAILADEMGLGKTLQTIALVWTLLKQNPIHEDGPVIKKALIVCPVSLINNWRKEFRKWLGNERIGVMVAETNKTRLTDFTMGKSYNIMIIGYEKLRTVQSELQKGAGIDIVIADEGHRLKTAQNKSAMAIKSLNTERRIILSGTPIQNDLSEFYTMVDFVNPGLLNKYTTFKREYENPILKSRQPGASAKDVEKGQSRSEELASITGQFILRRTAEILSKYLPPKTEYVLYCRPTDAQVACYEAIVSTGVFEHALKNSETSLQLINILKKVCNSPRLLYTKAGADDDGVASTVKTLTAGIRSTHLKSPSGSTKLQVLDTLLHLVRTTTSEKVVLVSNYTQTLDLLAKLMTAMDYPFTRLDGTTPTSQRQELVDRFNRAPVSSSFVFLLSAKAGGLGLNLVGASRLVLYDIDWNPATDLQAMARIHRDGQKRPCYIYRLLTKGALEEKMFQRQLTKQDLSDTIVDNKASASSFSSEELRDLFTLDRRGGCQTHDAIGCGCGGRKMGTHGGRSGESMVAKGGGGVDGDDSASSPGLGGEDVAEEAVKEKDDDDDDDDADDDDESLPELPSFVPSSQVNVEEEERKREARRKVEMGKGKAKKKMQSLMKYGHVDTRLFRKGEKRGVMEGDDDEEDKDEEQEVQGQDALEASLEMLVEDDVLRAAVMEENSRIDFVFAKSSE